MPKRNHSSSSNSSKRSSHSPKRPSASPRKRSPQRRSENQGSDQHKIYISGLPGGCRQQEVKQMCKKYGKIIDVLVVDKQQFSFAFVKYEQQSQAQEAIRKISGTQISNKTIRCQLAKPRAPRQNDGRREGQRDGAPRDGGNRGRSCFKCGKEGHIAKFCQNAEDDNRNDDRSKRSNRGREESRKVDRNNRGGRGDSKDSNKSPPKKQRNRKRSESSSSSESKPQRKRERQDSRSRKNKKRDSPVRKRKETSSSSNDKRKSRKRSRSAELRKGKKRQVSSSSSSR